MPDSPTGPSDPKDRPGDGGAAGPRGGARPGGAPTSGASSSPGRGPAHPPRRPDDVASLVRTIQKDVAQREAAMRKPGQQQRSVWWYAALVLAISGNLYVWIGRPTWLVGDALDPPTQFEEEGVLRFRMYVQGQRIESYVRQNGTLPARLEDTGEPLEGMRYQQTGPDSWELLGESERVSLILRSSQPMAEFLNDYQAALELDGQ